MTKSRTALLNIFFFHRPWIRFFIDIFLCISCYLFSFYGYATLHNTLQHNDNWHATKNELTKSVVGSDDFFTQTQALSHNSLHLGAWFGFQEIFKPPKLLPGEIRFSFSLTHNAYVYVIFDIFQSQFSAIRFSVHDVFPSAFITAATNGKFLTNIVIPTSFEENKTYQARIQFLQNPDTLRVFIDNQLIYTTQQIIHSISSSIGFRNSFAPTTVDTVTVTDQTGRTVFEDTFSYTDPYIQRIFIFVWIGIFLITQLARIYMKNTKKNHGSIIFWTLILFFVITCTYYIAAYIVSDKYWKPDSWFLFPWNRDINVWSMSLKNGFDDVFLTLPPKTGYRILFLGTSQTWGAGAMYASDTYVSQIDKLLYSKMLVYAHTPYTKNVLGAEIDGSVRQLDLPITCINGGAPGSDSTQLLTMYAVYWRDAVKPNLLVIDLSSNDIDNDAFEGNLKRFAEIDNAHNIKTVFILEANSLEAYPNTIVNHTIMKKVASEYHIPVIDLHEYLKSQADTGLIWWDYVHLTSYGQMLAASYIVTQLQTFAVLPK